MEHICINCEHWKKFIHFDMISKDPEIGSCVMLKQVKQALGDMPQDGLDTAGKKNTNCYQEYGVSTGAEYGKDCEYFTQKN